MGILLAFVTAFCLIAAGQATEQALSMALDPPLRGVRIVVDPGHGGIDDGTQIGGQYKEKDVNLQLGLVVRDVLQRMGAEVIMTRETDRELSRFSKVYNGRHREDLAKRVQIIRESACDLWVSLHCNCSVQHPGARGPVVYFGSSQPANPALAKAVQSRLNRINLEPFQASQRPHSAITADYYLLRNSTAPGILVEAGYLSNSLDLGLLINNQFQRAFATNLSLGIADYLHAPQPANSETALNKVIFLLPVDAEQPAVWAEMLASPLPLTFLIDGQVRGWETVARRIYQAGHDVVVSAPNSSLDGLATGVYLESGEETEDQTLLQIRAPSLLNQAGYRVDAIIQANTPAQFFGQLLQILQVKTDSQQIIQISYPVADLPELMPVFLEVVTFLEDQRIQPVFCTDLQVAEMMEP